MDNNVLQLAPWSLFTGFTRLFAPRRLYKEPHNRSQTSSREFAMAQIVFKDCFKNCKVDISAKGSNGKRKIEEENIESTILLTLRKEVLSHLIESEAKRKKKERAKICKFQETCKKKAEDCKFPHVPSEVLKDLRPPYYLCYKFPNCDRENCTFVHWKP